VACREIGIVWRLERDCWRRARYTIRSDKIPKESPNVPRFDEERVTHKQRLLVISPRPPSKDGKGDQKRALDAIRALEAQWEIEVVSWLHGAGERLLNSRLVSRAPTLLRFSLSLPAQVAYVQAQVPRSLFKAIEHADAILMITDRALSQPPRRPFVIDFVDDLSANATRRAEALNLIGRWFWRREARLVREFDSLLLWSAQAATAVSIADAASIGDTVVPIPLTLDLPEVPDDVTEMGDSVVFSGNLAYAPNAEAAMWICRSLAPALTKRGVDPSRVLIVGRRPPRALITAVKRAGVVLERDVPSIKDVLTRAGVCVAPMALGSGVQNKVLEAISAGRPCVITPLANVGLDLNDGVSAIVRARESEMFVDSVVRLLGNRQLAKTIAVSAREHLKRSDADIVSHAWRQLLGSIVPTVDLPNDLDGSEGPAH
jgi:hypothetical protein